MYKTLGFKWLFEMFCPASAFVSVDSDEARNPQRFIHVTVGGNFNGQCKILTTHLGTNKKTTRQNLVRMEFDITQLDKKILVQTLFAHSAPLRLGQAEYDFRRKLGDNVDGLSDEECEMILFEFNNFDTGGLRILDYHKGKPIKLVFYKNKNGRVLVDTGSYDARNGKYRFFEALLNIFSIDEILITKKGYKHYEMTDLPEHLVRPKEQEEIFKNILKNTVEQKNEYGKYWSIDESKVSYTPPFMQL